jgi:hypothetical protein
MRGEEVGRGTVERLHIVAGTYEIKILNEEVPTTRASDQAVQ